MTTRFDDKRPGEKKVLEFDFTRLTSAISGTPTIEVTVASGTDPDPGAIKEGSPAVVGEKVFQLVAGGLDGVVYALRCTVNGDSSTVHTVDGLLPVLARPLVSSAVPRYLTRAAFEQQFGVRELQDLTSEDNDFALAENAAAGIVDGYLAARYTLPLVSVPGMVLGWVADITRYRLWDEAAPEQVRQRYEDAMQHLKDLATGKLSLPPGADGAPAAGAVEFDGFSAERVFTSDTLKCF